MDTEATAFPVVDNPITSIEIQASVSSPNADATISPIVENSVTLIDIQTSFYSHNGEARNSLVLKNPLATDIQTSFASHITQDCLEDNDASKDAVDEAQVLAWKPSSGKSLEEAHASVKVPPPDAPWWRQFAAYSGLGIIVSVGYMDPGNWATDLGGGSSFGYTLLFVVLLSNFLAMYLQFLCIKLGAASGRDLAQACRDAYPSWLVYPLWILSEIAIAATDLAEVIGCAIAFNLLFGMPLWAGILCTLGDVFLLLALGNLGFRVLEVIIAVFTALIGCCFIYELARADPDWSDVIAGYVPGATVFKDSECLYLGISILGATVMPHNLFLHSALIQTRAYERNEAGRRIAIRYGTIDSCLSLFVAFCINSAILILASSVFYYGDPPQRDVADIQDAYQLLQPSLGSVAPILFALALLAAGQNSTITGTLAGQIVMEGFLQIKLPPWLRRLITRSIAVIPGAVVAATMGSSGVNNLLLLSQVILSLELVFAVAPLVHFTSSRAYVGNFANGTIHTVIACIITLAIGGINVYMLFSGISTGSLWS